MGQESAEFGGNKKNIKKPFFLEIEKKMSYYCRQHIFGCSGGVWLKYISFSESP
jgi:hypothetical protein